MTCPIFTPHTIRSPYGRCSHSPLFPLRIIVSSASCERISLESRVQADVAARCCAGIRRGVRRVSRVSLPMCSIHNPPQLSLSQAHRNRHLVVPPEREQRTLARPTRSPCCRNFTAATLERFRQKQTFQSQFWGKVNFRHKLFLLQRVPLQMIRAGRLFSNLLPFLLLSLSLRPGAAMRVLLVTGGLPSHDPPGVDCVAPLKSRVWGNPQDLQGC